MLLNLCTGEVLQNGKMAVTVVQASKNTNFALQPFPVGKTIRIIEECAVDKADNLDIGKTSAD